jgi:hypothetical protein
MFGLFYFLFIKAVFCRTGNKKGPAANGRVLDICGGDDEARTRDLRRDRPAF